MHQILSTAQEYQNFFPTTKTHDTYLSLSYLACKTGGAFQQKRITDRWYLDLGFISIDDQGYKADYEGPYGIKNAIDHIQIGHVSSLSAMREIEKYSDSN